MQNQYVQLAEGAKQTAINILLTFYLTCTLAFSSNASELLDTNSPQYTEQIQQYSHLPSGIKMSTNPMVPFVWDLLYNRNGGTISGLSSYQVGMELLAGRSVGDNRITDWNDPALYLMMAKEGKTHFGNNKVIKNSGLDFLASAFGTYFTRWKHHDFANMSPEYYEEKTEEFAMKALLSYAGRSISDYEGYENLFFTNKQSFIDNLYSNIKNSDDQNLLMNANWATFIIRSNFDAQKKREMGNLFFAYEEKIRNLTQVSLKQITK